MICTIHFSTDNDRKQIRNPHRRVLIIEKFPQGIFPPQLSAKRRPLSRRRRDHSLREAETTLHSLGEAETTLTSAKYKLGAITNSKNPKFAFGEFLPKLSAKPRPLSPALPETTLHSLRLCRRPLSALSDSLRESETTLGSAKYKLGAITNSKF